MTEETEIVVQIMRHFFKNTQVAMGATQKIIGPFPDNYTVFDFETSGVSFSQDLIVEAGYAIVRDRKVEHGGAVILDWTRSPLIDQQWLQDRLESTKYHVENKKGVPTGRTYHYSHDRLAQEGEDPIASLTEFYHLIKDCLDRKELLVAHNGWYFDRNMLDQHVVRFMTGQAKLPWTANSIFDTGLTEKAAQLGPRGLPRPEDNLTSFYRRIRDWRVSIKWALDNHCVPKYGLAEKHSLDMDAAHTGDFDCQVTSYLFEHWREMLETAAPDVKHG